jgi:hypothetical protein
MKKIVIVAVVALLLGATGKARGQDWFWGGAYSMSLPTGDTKAFNEGYSFRGVIVEGRKLMGDNASFGLSFGWQILNDIKTNETIELTSGALTGTFYTYTNSFPIFINAHYYLGKPASARPFVGLNAGAMIIERRAEVGLVAFQESNWHFGGAPEIGVVFPLGWYVRGLVSARYHYGFGAGGAPAQSYMTFNIGVASN